MKAGEQGIKDTLVVMAHLVEEARAEPIVLQTAWKLTESIPVEDARARVESIFDFTRGVSRGPSRGRLQGADALRWRPDPHNVELIQDAPLVILNGGADCEELSLTLAALLQAAGFPTEFVVISRRKDKEFHHVLIRIPVNKEKALYLDPSLPSPMGTVPSGITKAWAVSTFLNNRKTVDIAEIAPETIRGPEALSVATQTGDSSMTLSSHGLGSLSSSVVGSLGIEVDKVTAQKALLTVGAHKDKIPGALQWLQTKFPSWYDKSKPEPKPIQTPAPVPVQDALPVTVLSPAPSGETPREALSRTAREFRASLTSEELTMLQEERRKVLDQYGPALFAGLGSMSFHGLGSILSGVDMSEDEILQELSSMSPENKQKVKDGVERFAKAIGRFPPSVSDAKLALKDIRPLLSAKLGEYVDSFKDDPIGAIGKGLKLINAARKLKIEAAPSGSSGTGGSGYTVNIPGVTDRKTPASSGGGMSMTTIGLIAGGSVLGLVLLLKLLQPSSPIVVTAPAPGK